MTTNNNTRFVTPRQWTRIEQWSRRKPVFALMGEFSAGKSTLMNFLLRQNTLPTQVTATQLPPVWFSWGKRPAYVLRPDGTRKTIGLDELNQIGVQDAQFIRIYLEADILEAVDLIDTPGISDPKISSDVWQRAVGQANGVLWCTHATQAWRETERATWAALPERLHQNSLLLITRADTLGPKDRQKVLRRVNRETGQLFNRSILFSARDAITARDKTGDAELWTRSGGGKMVDSFLEITESIMNARADLLARYQIDKSLPSSPARTVELASEASANVTPLKLMNPVMDEEARETGDAPSPAIPIRPSRVARRADDESMIADRARIDAGEAEKLRAQVVQDQSDGADIADGVSDDDLRAFFRTPATTPLSIEDLAGGYDAEPQDDLIDDDFDDEEDLETEDLLAENEVASEENDGVLNSLAIRLADEDSTAPETTEQVAEDDREEDDKAVSSVTALLATETSAEASETATEPEAEREADEESEAEPQSESAEILPMPDLKAEDDEPSETDDVADEESEPDHSLEAAAGAPLSAASMWQQIIASETVPTNPDELLRVFQAFLEEFDQIAIEHHANPLQDGLQAIPNANAQPGADWHVL